MFLVNLVTLHLFLRWLIVEQSWAMNQISPQGLLIHLTLPSRAQPTNLAKQVKYYDYTYSDDLSMY